MFKITGGKGFHMTFGNGYTVSVQWGPGNYCDNYDSPFGQKLANPESTTAECAYWGPDGNMCEFEDSGDTVKGHMPVTDVLHLLNTVSQL